MSSASTKPHFDALIDLVANHLDAVGLSEKRANEAAVAIRASVESLPGAGWIDVEYHGRMPPSSLASIGDRWVQVFKAWNASKPEGPEWTRLRHEIEERFWSVLRDLAAQHPLPAEPNIAADFRIDPKT